LIDCLNRVA